MRDVVVVGGGPAGSVTALLLARAGLDVVLFDAREFPRAKPCGDCISPGANRYLRELGLWQRVLAANPAHLDAWRVSSGRSAFSAGFGDEVSLALPRERLDDILLDCAREAGVAVHTGTHVTGLLRDGARITGVLTDKTDKAQVPARLTIGADGLRSRTARLLHAYKRPPRLRKLSLTAHVAGVAHARATGEMSVLEDACLGIAPVDGTAAPLCNVTVVVKSGVQRRSGPHEMMRDTLRRFGRADIAELISDNETILASGPFDWPVRQTVFDGAALVGDAAGYFDPFTGQGVYQAIAGAHLLGDVASDALRRGSADLRALAPYAAAHARMTRGTRRVQRAIDYVCARPRMATAFFTGLSRTPELAERLVAVTGDMRSARVLLSPALLARFMAASLTAART